MTSGRVPSIAIWMPSLMNSLSTLVDLALEREEPVLTRRLRQDSRSDAIRSAGLSTFQKSVFSVDAEHTQEVGQREC